MTLFEFIEEKRIEKEMKVKELIDALGVSRSFYYNMKSHRPNNINLQKLSRVLEIPRRDLENLPV